MKKGKEEGRGGGSRIRKLGDKECEMSGIQESKRGLELWDVELNVMDGSLVYGLMGAWWVWKTSERSSMSCEWTGLKELDSVMGEDDLAYNCVKKPTHLTRYQPACSDLSHWMASGPI